MGTKIQERKPLEVRRCLAFLEYLQCALQPSQRWMDPFILSRALGGGLFYSHFIRKRAMRLRGMERPVQGRTARSGWLAMASVADLGGGVGFREAEP